MLTIVGQGLVGTLVALEAERRGLEFCVIDEGSGKTASRAAAGLFNPLTGPRFTAEDEGWDAILPWYRELEDRLQVSLIHPLPLLRPWTGAKVGAQAFPRQAPGWRAWADEAGVHVEGGGWLDIPALLDASRARWLKEGRLQQGLVDPSEVEGRPVLWATGMSGFSQEPWNSVPSLEGRWQAVRGDVLTVHIPGLGLQHGEIGPRFLLPLGNDCYRWGATHESDVDDQGCRPQAREQLETELQGRLGSLSYRVLDHAWGVRPASRKREPFLVQHPTQAGWWFLNGFGGRGVCQLPKWVPKAFEALSSLRGSWP